MFRKNNQQVKTQKDQLVIDTSGLMDGRIEAILSLGFLNYQILIPKFVVLELQAVADKSDKIRRDRARDALSLANELIKSGQAELSSDQVKKDEVDNMLIELAKKLKARLYTTDFNLQRVAEIQSVFVLNPNQLIHNIKLNFVPGEQIKLKLSTRGSEKNQAIGYINGVMIVVKNGESRIGQTVQATVSNLIESENGHIVFADMTNGSTSARANQKPKASLKSNKSRSQPARPSSNPKKYNDVKPKQGAPKARPSSNKPKFKKRVSPEDKMLASIEQFGD